jgi:hypothetical protein
MTRKTGKNVLWMIAILALIVGLQAAYLAGYRNGGRDALDWDFAAVVGGKVVRLGRGDALLRSRLDLRPTPNVNFVSAPFGISGKQP